MLAGSWDGYRLALDQVSLTVHRYLHCGQIPEGPERQRLEQALEALRAGWGDARQVQAPLGTLRSVLGAMHDERAIPARAHLNTVVQWVKDLEEHAQP